MSLPSAVSNSSPLIGLARIGQLSLLEHLFATVRIPGAVRLELGPAFSVPAWIVETPLTQPVGPRLLRGSLGPGEAEAVSLALEVPADWILLDLARPNLTPTRLDNLMENLIWAADGSEVETVVARGRLLKQGGRVLPFADGTSPEAIMAAAQRLSESFAEYRRTAPELRGTGAHR